MLVFDVGDLFFQKIISKATRSEDSSIHWYISSNYSYVKIIKKIVIIDFCSKMNKVKYFVSVWYHNLKKAPFRNRFFIIDINSVYLDNFSKLYD